MGISRDKKTEYVKNKHLDLYAKIYEASQRIKVLAGLGPSEPRPKHKRKGAKRDL